MVNMIERLRLTDEDQVALVRQGFVAAEFRSSPKGRRGPYFKLRWRDAAGRQQVRYLGRNPEKVQQVRDVLAEWQRSRALAAEVRTALADLRSVLRDERTSSSADMAARGYRWHGYQSRCSQPQSEVSSSASNPYPQSPGGNDGSQVR